MFGNRKTKRYGASACKPIRPVGRAAACLVAVASALYAAASPVTIAIDLQATGPTVPADYLGLSFETANLLPEPDGAHLFSAANQPFIALFRTLGIESLRMGGAMADRPDVAVPGVKDIDQLFAFAAAADVKVIYTLRLPHARPADDASLARYIWQHYAAQLTCFEIGNEPDFYRRVYREIPDYPAYRALWKADRRRRPGRRPRREILRTRRRGRHRFLPQFRRRLR